MQKLCPEGYLGYVIQIKNRGQTKSKKIGGFKFYRCINFQQFCGTATKDGHRKPGRFFTAPTVMLINPVHCLIYTLCCLLKTKNFLCSVHVTQNIFF